MERLLYLIGIMLFNEESISSVVKNCMPVQGKSIEDGDFSYHK